MFCLALTGKMLTGLWVVPLKTFHILTVGFAMSAWGEFAFITATTARAQGIMDQTTFSSAILAVCFSVVVSPTLLRYTIRRSAKSAVASITLARMNSTAPGASSPHATSIGSGMAGEGTLLNEVPVYYHLTTRSKPAWGLNARLMELLAVHDLAILDFRSQHSTDMVRLSSRAHLKIPAHAFRRARVHLVFVVVAITTPTSC